MKCENCGEIKKSETYSEMVIQFTRTEPNDAEKKFLSSSLERYPVAMTIIKCKHCNSIIGTTSKGKSTKETESKEKEVVNYLKILEKKLDITEKRKVMSELGKKFKGFNPGKLYGYYKDYLYRCTR